MAHVSHKLSNAFEGALAGGGDPATSPLYVFGPFLKLIVVAGVAQITFGASIWLVVFTVAMVSAMYRLVMHWVVDGSGGSGLSEEEFGSWAVKLNAGITFVEYTLTFLVSMAALVTFIADRVPLLNETAFGFQYRTFVAIILSVLTGWLVNRGPKAAARAFGPATAGVLLLLWAMVIATIIRQGFHLPDFNLEAFRPEYLGFTFGGYARILAVMTGIEIFANLVAAYDGAPAEKSRKAFGSLLIIMGTTSITMLVVGPAILALSDPTNEHVSVFTQTMDLLLPAPLAYAGTLVGIAVLLSASAASAQGLQNLALGLKYRHYVPAFIGQKNRFDVADKPVWLEVGIVALCFFAFGTNEETYLAIYAAGVFILLSMTGWAAAKRLLRQLRAGFSLSDLAALLGTTLAALLTSGATIIIFEERFFEGAWTYLLFLPILYLLFSYFRHVLGEPSPLEERLGLILTEKKYLAPYQPDELAEEDISLQQILIPLDGSPFAEQALPLGQSLVRQERNGRLTLATIKDNTTPRRFPFSRKSEAAPEEDDIEAYLNQLTWHLQENQIAADYFIGSGPVAEGLHTLAQDSGVDLVVMCTHGRSGMERWLIGSVANRMVQISQTPLLLTRPTEQWRSRTSRFQRLLVTLDGSPAAEKVLPYVRLLAARFNSQILLLSVPEGEVSEAHVAQLQDYLQQSAAALQASGFTAEALVTGSRPAQTIVSTSEEQEVDLIMLATHGRSNLDRFMIGSVADRVIRHTQCPVFLVPIGRH